MKILRQILLFYNSVVMVAWGTTRARASLISPVPENFAELEGSSQFGHVDSPVVLDEDTF